MKHKSSLIIALLPVCEDNNCIILYLLYKQGASDIEQKLDDYRSAYFIYSVNIFIYSHKHKGKHLICKIKVLNIHPHI